MTNYKFYKNIYTETIRSMYHDLSNEAYRNNKYDYFIYISQNIVK